MQTDHHQIWETYTSAWKTESADEKRALIAATLARDCTYQDPLAKVSGADELIAYMRNFHQQMPGAHFVTRRFRFHHGQSVAQWDMVDAQGKVIGDGVSVGHYNDAGRLVTITGFFDI
ncbi:nuclear transport factor 2 family protein [Undibacterium sp.]|uniref:nuclear transport factor 2 family protein n=1 Tax=Undibacterium sp. TaxID=1914977 RepID=UPI00374D3A0B